MLKKLEGILENFIFNSRWLLTPIYIVLVLTLIIIGVKTVQEFLYEITHIFDFLLIFLPSCKDFIIDEITKIFILKTNSISS